MNRCHPASIIRSEHLEDTFWKPVGDYFKHAQLALFQIFLMFSCHDLLGCQAHLSALALALVTRGPESSTHIVP